MDAKNANAPVLFVIFKYFGSASTAANTIGSGSLETVYDNALTLDRTRQ
jgi:hypothetical protein